MELKVWVEGIQRIVCGVTVNTTCQDVVFALAHATSKVGRFTLIERWRNNERLLAPNENPLKLLLKWGEYANDVQFILQRSENKQHQQQQRNETQFCGTNNNNINDNNSSNVMKCDSKNSPLISTTNTTVAIISTDIVTTAHNNVKLKKPLGISNNNINNIEQQQQQQHGSNEKIKDFRRNFGDNLDAKQNENIGIVRGVPQRPNTLEQQQKFTSPQKEKPHVPVTKTQSMNYKQSDVKNSSPVPIFTPRHEKSHSNPVEMTNSNSYKFYATESAIVGSAGGEQFSYNNNNNNNIYQQLGAHNSKSINDINLAAVRNALDRSAINDSDEKVFKNNKNNNNINNNNNSKSNATSSENLLEMYNVNNRKSYDGSPNSYNSNNNTNNNNNSNAPTISSNGALVPPPYRDPPPPRNSPQTMQQQQQQQQSQLMTTNNPYSNEDYNNDFDFNISNNNKNNHINSNKNNNNNNNNNNNVIEEGESIFPLAQYNDLLQLIKFQKDKISAQQTELTKYDVEIVYLENKERDQAQELEAISREISKADQTFRQGSEQLQTLQYVEEENELVKQQEKTLKSEIALLRSKLANCETELLQCKNKVRMLMDDIEVEQRAISNKQKHNRQNVERDFLIEMERIQSEIDQAIQNTDTSNKTAENLKKEILLIENAITEKKRQVEQLVKEMKEVNLQSLTITTAEEIKHLLEAPLNKPAGIGVGVGVGVVGGGGGSSRRIIGSPRQLENAVPTSKNPHGVWV